MRHRPARVCGGHGADASVLAAMQNVLYSLHAAGKTRASSAAIPAPHFAMQLVAWMR